MGIEMWFKDDIRNILLAVNASSATTARLVDHPQVAAYRLGYQEALGAVALACGLPPHVIGAGRGHSLAQVSAADLDTGEELALTG